MDPQLRYFWLGVGGAFVAYFALYPLAGSELKNVAKTRSYVRAARGEKTP